MDKIRLAKLASRHGRNAVAEEAYRHFGIDYTRPVSFYAIVNENCNVKCRYCNYWRQDEYREMPIEDWKRGLLSIKDFVGTFSISFSGGEPLLKRGFIDLLAWCRENGISAGVTTNGSGLNRKNSEKIVAAQPFNVNISVDAPVAEVHDFLRGHKGLFKLLSDGIGYLVEERVRQGVQFPIVIKPTVNSANFRYLPALVEWTKEIGATCVSPQPMGKWTPETFEELWIDEDELPELEAVIDRLCEMAEAGAPILTPARLLKLIPDHFRGQTAPREALPCRVGTRNFFIRANGDVELCHRGFPVVGNLRQNTAREIWTGAKAREVRRDTYSCERLCLVTCVSQKSIVDKAKMGIRLLMAQNESAARHQKLVTMETD
jgi:MoaA/NifB/PqqE/SkfB family radical SAM enzyme